jgi:hypothetical protein
MKILSFISISFLLISCDGGLTLPPDVEPGIVGTMVVSGPWPPEDSVKTLWLFASQIFPIDSSKVVTGILDGRIVVYPSLLESLPYNVSTQPFQMALPPSRYLYIGVLQRHGDNLFDPASYRVVGVLWDEENPTEPRALTVRDFEVISGLAIQIDFYNLPPQPF